MQGCTQGVGQYWVLTWGQSGEGSTFKFIQLLEAFSSSQATGLRYQFLSGGGLEPALSSLPHGLLHMATHKLVACFLKASKETLRVSQSMCITYAHVIMSISSRLHILLVRNKSQVQPALKRRRLSKSMNKRPPWSLCTIFGDGRTAEKGDRLQKGRGKLLEVMFIMFIMEIVS